MELKPLANIGEIVHIQGNTIVQTGRGFHRIDLPSNLFGKKRNYYIHDIEVTTSLKTGKVKYSYLISDSIESEEYGGWVSHNSLELPKSN